MRASKSAVKSLTEPKVVEGTAERNGESDKRLGRRVRSYKKHVEEIASGAASAEPWRRMMRGSPPLAIAKLSRRRSFRRSSDEGVKLAPNYEKKTNLFCI